jgi:hypothetical protein
MLQHSGIDNLRIVGPKEDILFPYYLVTGKLPVNNDGKSKIVNTHSHKYYPIRPKIPKQQMMNQPIY